MLNYLIYLYFCKY